MAKAMDVADLIIELANEQGKPVSNLKLQKVMYFLNVQSLLEKGTPLITDYKFEKWDYGPVIHSVYSEYSNNGATEILKPKDHQVLLQTEDGFFDIKVDSFERKNMRNDDIQFIESHIAGLLKYGPFELVDYSHEEPQWSDRSIKTYDGRKTKRFYSKRKNQFWAT